MNTKGSEILTFDAPAVHTLAQLRQYEPKPLISTVTKGDKNNLKKRARSKYFTNHLVYKLVNQKSSLQKSYWNTWHCTNLIQQEGQKLTAKYCNNRWCQVCNRIRTAKAIKGYLPQIEKLADPYFITLSRPNVKAEDLKEELKGILSEFKKVQNYFRRTHGTMIKGLRKVECTYNYRLKTYHPHIHLIADGGESYAREIVSQWLKINPTAHIKGQDHRPVNDESGALELFKYFTKLTTKIEVGNKTVNFIHAESLNVIFEAMVGRRVYQPIGGLQKVSEDVEELQAEEMEELEAKVHEIWQFHDEPGDWINTDGEALTGYTPSGSMKELTGAKNYTGNYDRIIIDNINRFKDVKERRIEYESG